MGIVNIGGFLQLATKSIQCVYIFVKAIIGASILYSKYVVAFTDEERTKIFLNEKNKMKNLDV